MDANLSIKLFISRQKSVFLPSKYMTDNHLLILQVLPILMLYWMAVTQKKLHFFIAQKINLFCL